MNARKWWRPKTLAALVVLAWLLRLPVPDVEADAPTTDERPRLAVLVVFDQMRGDYLERWNGLYGENGFKRLLREGAWYANCHYPYAYTLTAPGHTSLVTGATPSKHGIIANDWYDRVAGDSVSSVTPPKSEVRNGSGPYRRRAQTVGDVLLDMLMGRGRVASLSIKDRAAILMAAMRAQFVYWYDTKQGGFVTSPYYGETSPTWVKNFNRSRPADKWVGKTWDRFRPGLDYAKHSGPDDVFGEGVGYDQGRTFPHAFAKFGKEAKERERYFQSVDNSPYGNDLILSFAKAAIVSERLGQKEGGTDLLCLSFSSNDLVGHCWGPDSQEVLDVTLRSDALIADLLAFLDQKVGKGKYVFAMSADHGVCPLPEVSAERGIKATRVPPTILTTRGEAFLNETFLPAGEKAPWFLTPKKANPWVYLNPATLAERKLEPAVVERALAGFLAKQPGIVEAFARSDVQSGKSLSPIGEMVRKSFHPDGSGDVMAILDQHCLFSEAILTSNPDKSPAYRTSHGTPHAYDTHVPLVVLGPRVVPGRRDERVTPQATASILAEALRIPPPKDAEYPVPAGLFAK